MVRRQPIPTLRSVSAVRAVLNSAVRTMAVDAAGSVGDVLFRLPSRRRQQLHRRTSERPRVDGRWFTTAESEQVNLLASLIMPSEDDSPGAADVAVLGTAVVQQIDTWVASDPRRQFLYTRGLVALNEITERGNRAPF